MAQMQMTGIAHALRSELNGLNDRQLAEYEMRVNDALADVISCSEKRAPGYLAARLLAQIDECPLLACGIPAYMAGATDPLDLGVVGDGAERIGYVPWPQVRARFHKFLPDYFRRVAAGKSKFQIEARRPVRIFNIVQSKWLLLKIQDQAELAKRYS